MGSLRGLMLLKDLWYVRVTHPHTSLHIVHTGTMTHRFSRETLATLRITRLPRPATLAASWPSPAPGATAGGTNQGGSSVGGWLVG